MKARRTRITRDRRVLQGKPVIDGTRLSVELVLGWLAQGWTQEKVLQSYPNLTREDVLACVAYAARLVRRRHLAGRGASARAALSLR